MKKYTYVVLFSALILLPASTYAAQVKTTPKVAVALPVPIITSSTFQRNLTIGSSGTDVFMLQKYLNLRGYTIAKSGTGSRGKETTTFGSLTRNALVKFQLDHRIAPQSGYFGTITRATILKLENDLRVGLANASSSGSGGGTGSANGTAGAQLSSLHQSPQQAQQQTQQQNSNQTQQPQGQATASSTPSMDVSLIARDLSYGSEGWDVLALQKFLSDHGYNVGLTSIFDQQTLQAIAQFQSDYGLPVSGYVGSFTLSIIDAVQNGTYVPGGANSGDQLVPISHIPVLIQGN